MSLVHPKGENNNKMLIHPEKKQKWNGRGSGDTFRTKKGSGTERLDRKESHSKNKVTSREIRQRQLL
jgi:hypothetical protein